MTTIDTFFGPSANEVLAGYRRVRHAAQTVTTLADRLKELGENRDALRARHDSEIRQQRSRVAETEEQRERATQQLDRIGRKYRRLKRTLDSFWGRMGMRLRRILSSDAPSVKEARRQLDGFERGLKKLEEEIEYLTRVWTKQKRALERLTVPIEDLEFAFDYLQREKATAEREMVEQNAAIDEAIRQTVRAMTPGVLRRKLPYFAGQLDASEMMETVFRLRIVLAKSQALSHLIDSATVDADASTPMDNVPVAITSGFGTCSGRGRGKMDFDGTGATRVKKTRTRTEPSTDSTGRPSMRTRTETYWHRVQVRFSGTIDAGFDVEFNQWNKDTTAGTLRSEADRWFRHGTKRLVESRLRGAADKLTEEATTLIGRIRSALERSTFDAKCSVRA